jgi:hypothetical protein
MAFRFGPKLITEGLAFYVDAANFTSYPGSGTTWNDITINALNGTLTNSPTYTTQGGGGITFSSASQQTFAFPNVPITTESFAFDFWITLSGYGGTSNPGEANWVGMLSTVNAIDYQPLITQTTGVAIGFFSQRSDIIYGAICTGSVANPVALRSWVEGITGSVSPNLVSGSTYNIIVQRNNDTSHLELYVNGVYYSKIFIPNSSYNMSGSIPLRSSIRGVSSVDSLYPNYTYHNIKIYKGKYLTQAEVTQNYNALKGRFGL